MPQSRIAQAIESVRGIPQLATAEKFIQNGLENMQDGLSANPGLGRVAAVAAGGVLALGASHSLAFSTDHEASAQEPPYEEPLPEIVPEPIEPGPGPEPPPISDKERDLLCMSHALPDGQPNVYFNKPPIIKGKRLLPGLIVRDEAVTTITSDDPNSCNPGSRTLKLWPVMENDKGRLVRNGKVIYAAKKSNEEVNRVVNVRLKRPYTCEPGPGVRKALIMRREVASYGNKTSRNHGKLDYLDFASRRFRLC